MQSSEVEFLNPKLDDTMQTQRDGNDGLSRLTCRKRFWFRDSSTPNFKPGMPAARQSQGWLCKENYGGQEESSEEGCKEGEEGFEEERREEVKSRLRSLAEFARTTQEAAGVPGRFFHLPAEQIQAGQIQAGQNRRAVDPCGPCEPRLVCSQIFLSIDPGRLIRADRPNQSAT